MARVLKREAAKRDLIAQWVWYAENAEKILLFYLPLKDGVDLIRVAHGSRDLERLLAEGFFG